VVKAATKR